MRLRTTLLLTLIAASCCCVQADPELEVSDVNKQLNELGLPELPGGASPEQGQKAFDEQCRKHGGEAAVEKAKVAQKEIVQCFQQLVNVTAVQHEIEEAKPTGNLDTVFKKYCRKTPELLQCAGNFTHEISGCLAEDQQRLSAIIQDVAKTVLNFTCFKEGDRIALFIAEGGPECLESKQNDIQECLNATFGKYAENLPSPGDVNITDLSNFEFPLFLFDDSQCKDLDDAAQCVVERLEKCRDPTPANVVESIYKVIRKVIPCKTTVPSDSQEVTRAGLGSPSSSVSLYVSLPAVLLATLLATL